MRTVLRRAISAAPRIPTSDRAVMPLSIQPHRSALLCSRLSRPRVGLEGSSAGRLLIRPPPHRRIPSPLNASASPILPSRPHLVSPKHQPSRLRPEQLFPLHPHKILLLSGSWANQHEAVVAPRPLHPSRRSRRSRKRLPTTLVSHHPSALFHSGRGRGLGGGPPRIWSTSL